MSDRAHEAAVLQARLHRLGWRSPDMAACASVRADTVRRWTSGRDPIPDRVWALLDGIDRDGLIVQARTARADGRAWDRPDDVTHGEWVAALAATVEVAP